MTDRKAYIEPGQELAPGHCTFTPAPLPPLGTRSARMPPPRAQVVNEVGEGDCYVMFEFDGVGFRCPYGNLSEAQAAALAEKLAAVLPAGVTVRIRSMPGRDNLAIGFAHEKP